MNVFEDAILKVLVGDMWLRRPKDAKADVTCGPKEYAEYCEI